MLTITKNLIENQAILKALQLIKENGFA